MGCGVVKIKQKSRDFRAVKWTGDNMDEIRTFFRAMGYRTSANPCTQPLEGPYFGIEEDSEDPYNTLQFQCCEDHEVDPGNYVVFVWAWDALGVWGDTEERWYYYATASEHELRDEFELVES